MKVRVNIQYFLLQKSFCYKEDINEKYWILNILNVLPYKNLKESYSIIYNCLCETHSCLIK